MAGTLALLGHSSWIQRHSAPRSHAAMPPPPFVAARTLNCVWEATPSSALAETAYLVRQDAFVESTLSCVGIVPRPAT